MKKNAASVPQAPEALLSDLQALLTEAERMAEGDAGEDSGAEDLRGRLDAAHARFSELCGRARRGVVTGAESTDQMIRSNPYQSMAIALGAGLLLGSIIARRK